MQKRLMVTARCAVAVVGALLTGCGAAAAQAISGLALYEQHCGTCHSSPAPGSRAPDRVALSQRTPEAILEAITTGVMTVNAAGLTPAQKRVVAETVALRPLGSLDSGHVSAMKNQCAPTPFGDPAKSGMWSGWSAEAGNTRFQPAAAARLTPTQVPGLTLKWAFAFPNGTSAFGQPAVAGGRVFVGSDNGFVYAIDAASGCCVLVVSGAGLGANRDQRRAAHHGNRRALRDLFRRSEGQRLRRRRRVGRRGVDQTRRPTSDDPDYRCPDAARGTAVCAAVLSRGGRRRQSQVRMLHVPRRRRRLRCEDRRGNLAAPIPSRWRPSA